MGGCVSKENTATDQKNRKSSSSGTKDDPQFDDIQQPKRLDSRVEVDSGQQNVKYHADGPVLPSRPKIPQTPGIVVVIC